uniref:Uncharacterized protein LOC105632294 n=1 Tax=Rhizophora mucronata TaxID=61149 RepID=A0A2P2P119_RHIMU
MTPRHLLHRQDPTACHRQHPRHRHRPVVVGSTSSSNRTIRFSLPGSSTSSHRTAPSSAQSPPSIANRW